RGLSESRRTDRLVIALHWLIVAGIGIAFPIVAATALKGLDGQPWVAPAVGFSAAAGAAVIALACMLLQRRASWAPVAAALLIMLGSQVLFMYGYANTRAGRADFRPLAEKIWERCPDA